MELRTATLAHFKKNRNEWTAFLSDRTTKVRLSLSDLKVVEGGSLRDIGPMERRPKPERQQTVVVALVTTGEDPKINAWGLVPA